MDNGEFGRVTVPVECRDAETGRTLTGVIVQEGRAATGGRAEVFAPGSVVWPSDGIELRTRHRGPAFGRAVPERDGAGRIRVVAPAGPDAIAAFEAGRRFLSVEFRAHDEIRTAGGVREIRRAFVHSAAMTDRPEYGQARAEVRSRRRKTWQ